MPDKTKPTNPTRQPGFQEKLYWTLGNLLLLVGVYTLFYAGGLYAQAEYFRMAARGDNDLPAPQIIRSSSGVSNGPLAAEPIDSIDTPDGAGGWEPLPDSLPAESSPFTAPVLNGETRPNPALEGFLAEYRQPFVSAIDRIVIPSVEIDAKVIEVRWETKTLKNGQEIKEWQVAEYAVGHHYGSANPGDNGNIVMAGHVAGYGKVFRELYYVEPGDHVTVYSGGQQFLYVVQDKIIVDDEDAPLEQRLANGEYIKPTDHEVVTLVTCWPITGFNRFQQRIIVQAVPYGTSAEAAAQSGPLPWNVR